MKKDIDKIPSPRLQRLKIKLLRYNLELEYCPGKKLVLADLLSGSYIKDKVEDDESMTDIVHSVEANMGITKERRIQFENETKKDKNLQDMIKFVNDGWPKQYKNLNSNLKPFWPYKEDITFSNNLLFVGDRLIVPQSLKNDMLKLLHESHFGMTKTKLKAKQLFYWPK